MSNSENPALGLASTRRDLALSWLGAALPGLYLLLTSTVSLPPGIWPYDAKRMLQFGLLFMLFLLPALNQRVRTKLAGVMADIPRWLHLSLITLFAWGVLSAWTNARSPMHFANSLSEVVLLGSLVLSVFVVAACRRTGGRAFDRIAVALLALTGLGVGVQELLGVAAAHASDITFNFRISLLHFSWPRFYNQIQSWSVPVIVALPLLFSRYSLARVLCVLVLGLHWYVILATGARGTFVALCLAMLFAALFLPLIRRPLLIWQVAGFALGAGIYLAVLLSFQHASPPTPQPLRADPTLQDSAIEPKAGFYRNEDENTNSFLAQSVARPLLDPMGRTWMWKVTLKDAKEHPWLGIGPMNYVCTSPVYMSHPHNFPLQIAAEWGLPAALAVCLLFLMLLWQITGRLREPPTTNLEDWALSGLLLTGILAAALHACVSGVLVMPASQVAGLLICGMFLGLAPRAVCSTAKRAAAWTLGAGLLMSTGLLILGVHELRTMPERSAQMRPGEDMRPRIWQDSKVCRLYAQQINGTN